MAAATSRTSSCGSRAVGISTTSTSGWPSRSARSRDVWLALTSTATTQRRRVSMCRCIGLRAAAALALVALEHEARLEQLVHQPAHRAARHAHQARELGARDRLL